MATAQSILTIRFFPTMRDCYVYLYNSILFFFANDRNQTFLCAAWNCRSAVKRNGAL